MEGSHLKSTLHKKLRGISKNAEKAISSFDAEAIHDLRVSYKKLRAFTRLLDTKEKMKLPGTLKAIYNTAGALRNQQIYLRDVEAFCRQSGNSLTSYARTIAEEIEKNKHAFKTAVENISFDSIEERLEKKLPENLTDEIVIEFIENKQRDISTLFIFRHTQTSLHTIRKHLKDILYVLGVFKDDGSFKAPAVLKKQGLKKLAEALGIYMDVCTNLAILESTLSGQLAKSDKQTLLRLQKTWVKEMRARKAKIESMLPGRFNLTS